MVECHHRLSCHLQHQVARGKSIRAAKAEQEEDISCPRPHARDFGEGRVHVLIPVNAEVSKIETGIDEFPRYSQQCAYLWS